MGKAESEVKVSEEERKAADVTTVRHLTSQTMNQSAILKKSQQRFRCLSELRRAVPSSQGLVDGESVFVQVM